MSVVVRSVEFREVCGKHVGPIPQDLGGIDFLRRDQPLRDLFDDAAWTVERAALAPESGSSVGGTVSGSGSIRECLAIGIWRRLRSKGRQNARIARDIVSEVPATIDIVPVAQFAKDQIGHRTAQNSLPPRFRTRRNVARSVAGAILGNL